MKMTIINNLYITKYFNYLQYILICNSQGGVKFSTGGDSFKLKNLFYNDKSTSTMVLIW